MIDHHTYSVKGMHCPSCEMIVERKLKKITGIKSAEALMSAGSVTIGCEGVCPPVEELNRIFAGTEYSFAESALAEKSGRLSGLAQPLAIAVIAIAAFFAISSTGVSLLVMITPESTYGALFLFGLIAGISSCAALTGGLVLSLSAGWLASSGEQGSMVRKTIPHILFNSGRIAAYTLLGALLGLVGETIKISSFVSGAAVIAVSLLMVALALQMLGFTSFSRLRIALPKKFSAGILSKKHEKRAVHPLITGSMTVLLPCGFTMISEGAAVLSGSALQGMLIMFFFVLGTTPALLGIGISSMQLSSNRKTSPLFLKTSGLLIIFFVMYNLNVQFGTAGLITGQGSSSASASLSGPDPGPAVQASEIPGSGNIQPKTVSLVYTEATDIAPNSFTVKRGEKVRFEVNPSDTGSGCMSTIMVPGLWERAEPLIKGKKIVMEFTPERTGSYKITCAMGVPRGVILVR